MTGVDGFDEPASLSELTEGPPAWSADAAPLGARPGRPSTASIVTVCLLAAVAVITIQHTRRPPAAAHGPALGPVTSSSIAPSATVAAPPLAHPSVTAIGRPVLAVPSDWELFARGHNSLLRIQLAAGRITRTSVPLLNSNGAVSFVVGPDRVIIRPLDFVAGYQVLDGRPATELSSPTMRAGPLLPGPDRWHVWTPNANTSAMMLSSWDGRPTGLSLPVEPVWAQSDGAGYLAVDDIGGVYDARPSGLHRLTTGVLLAAGPTGWLTDDCDEQDQCRAVLTVRATGTKRAMPGRVKVGSSPGLISPDGRCAALIELTPGGLQVTLLDLQTGVEHPTGVKLADGSDASSLVWTPDSSLLFAADASGQLVTVKPAGQVGSLGLTLPPLSQLGFRAG